MHHTIEIHTDKVQLDSSWKTALGDNLHLLAPIKAELLHAKARGEIVYPPNSMIFNAFNKTSFDRVKAVIIGQDPYHGEGQAMGLSFSVPKGVRIPPSLINIYKELARTTPNFSMPNHGDLSAWAAQGVLLLNASLTVCANQAGSHSKIGWQAFTDAAISALSKQRQHIVFMLWGNFAKAKAPLIDASRHLILTAVHPSPLAGGKFIGCNHFQQTNAYLIAHGYAPINWQV